MPDQVRRSTLVTDMFDLVDEWGLEKVVCVSDCRTGMNGVSVIDNTARGMTGLSERDAAIFLDELGDRGAAVGLPRALGGLPYDELEALVVGVATSAGTVIDPEGLYLARLPELRQVLTVPLVVQSQRDAFRAIGSGRPARWRRTRSSPRVPPRGGCSSTMASATWTAPSSPTTCMPRAPRCCWRPRAAAVPGQAFRDAPHSQEGP